MLKGAKKRLGLGSRKPKPLQKVVLASTPLGFGVGSLQAYHTSLLVNDVEYAFSDEGICVAHGLRSHAHLPKYPSETVTTEVGYARGEANVLAVLQVHFERGSYDLLRKNCNSFSDCGLAYLVGGRLEDRFCQMEKIGHTADRYTGLVQMATGGAYTPNPRADKFQKELVLSLAREAANREVVLATRKSKKRSILSMFRCEKEQARQPRPQPVKASPAV